MSLTLYLWRDLKGEIHALSPDRYETLGAMDAPANPSESEQSKEIGLDAASILPNRLWQWLCVYLGQQPIALILDCSLPDGWHKLAWEQLGWRGSKLGISVQITRYAITSNQQKRSATGKTLIWNQWPEDHFSSLLKRQDVEECWQTRKLIEHEIERGRDIGRFARLIILAHGDSTGAAHLLDKQGLPWTTLNLASVTLPEEVYIIACASYHGNLHDLIIDCLRHGAKSVICGHGPLNAELMNEALNTLLDANSPAHQALREQQEKDVTPPLGGVSWLRYYGSAPLNELDNLTLAFYQNAEQPNPVDQISREIDIEDKAEVVSFLHSAKSNMTQYWPLTQYWLLPVALYWAEYYDHALAHQLKMQLPDLSSTSLSHYALKPARAIGLSSLYRRQGEYPKAMQQLADGWQASPQPKQEIELLGALLNNFIDFNLPTSGQAALDRLDHLLTCIDYPIQEFRLLDRRARLALRKGKIFSALSHLTIKRQQVQSQQKDDIRELAGLLYNAAWFNHQNAESYAKTAIDRLRQNDVFGAGNDSLAYLARALAVWEWRHKQNIDKELKPYAQLCKQQLCTPQDPGPYAYILIFRQLARNQCYGENWELAVDGLERGRYWLELAAFHALAGQKFETKGSLQQFHHMRNSAFKNIESVKLADLDWREECDNRQAMENRILLADKVDANVLATSGLLPL